jgi:hypothetical protein
VHFIRWSPNGEKVFLSLWRVMDKEGRNPSEWKLENTYWVYDVNQQLLLSEFQDEIRWFYYYGHGAYTSYSFYKKSINFPEKSCAHPNSVRFSPDGNRLVWITMNDQVKELDLIKNEIRVIISQFQEGEYIVSIGFLENPETLWIGALFEEILTTYPFEQSSTKMIIFKNIGAEFQRIQEEEQLYFVPLDSSSYESWWLVLNPYQSVHPAVIGMAVSMTHSLYLLSTKEIYLFRKVGGGVWGDYRMRSAFLENGSRIELLLFANSYPVDLYSYIQSREYDVTTLQKTKETPWIFAPDFDGYLLQPFSPDGEEFLHIRDGKLYIYTTDTMQGEVVLPKPAAVSGYESLK